MMRSTAIPTAKKAAATRRRLVFIFIRWSSAYFTMTVNGTLIFTARYLLLAGGLCSHLWTGAEGEKGGARDR
jgi:hypothetical protein